jgi:hypothetical protein
MERKFIGLADGCWRKGSLNLFHNAQKSKDRKFGVQVSEFQFLDKDGVEVIASLNVDDNGNLF